MLEPFRAQYLGSAVLRNSLRTQTVTKNQRPLAFPRTYYLGTEALKSPEGPTIWALGGLGRHSPPKAAIALLVWDRPEIASYGSLSFGSDYKRRSLYDFSPFLEQESGPQTWSPAGILCQAALDRFHGPP